MHIYATILNYLYRLSVRFPIILIGDRLWFAQRLFQAGGIGDDSKLEIRAGEFVSD